MRSFKEFLETKEEEPEPFWRDPKHIWFNDPEMMRFVKHDPEEIQKWQKAASIANLDSQDTNIIGPSIEKRLTKLEIRLTKLEKMLSQLNY